MEGILAKTKDDYGFREVWFAYSNKQAYIHDCTVKHLDMCGIDPIFEVVSPKLLIQW